MNNGEEYGPCDEIEAAADKASCFNPMPLRMALAILPVAEEDVVDCARAVQSVKFNKSDSTTTLYAAVIFLWDLDSTAGYGRLEVLAPRQNALMTLMQDRVKLFRTGREHTEVSRTTIVEPLLPSQLSGLRNYMGRLDPQVSCGGCVRP